MFRFASICTALVIALTGAAKADWSASPQSLGQAEAVNQTFTIACAPDGTGTVWGTGLYTSDSSICAAARHAGWMPAGTGAIVSYFVLPGQQSYAGSTQNGITTFDYGAWGASFQITGAAPSGGGVTGTPITWNDTLDSLGVAENVGQSYVLVCPPGSGSGTIWGTLVYTSDSPICLAAQHAGLLSPAFGGTVTVQVSGPMGNYMGTLQNGVTSSGYGAWPRSYGFR